MGVYFLPFFILTHRLVTNGTPTFWGLYFKMPLMQIGLIFDKSFWHHQTHGKFWVKSAQLVWQLDYLFNWFSMISGMALKNLPNKNPQKTPKKPKKTLFFLFFLFSPKIYLTDKQGKFLARNHRFWPKILNFGRKL